LLLSDRSDVMNFQEAIAYVTALGKLGFNFGLSRMEELLRRFDNPHLKLKVIHVGGTNGKGSTAVMVAAILQAAGFKVGTFTSPHLHSYTERFRINGMNIPEAEVAALIDELRPHIEALVQEGLEHPTEFEVATAVALLYFSRAHVDYLVLEVGLGGTLDATNVVRPLVSVITNVAMDHMDYLGHTLRAIAGEKAGIIKPGVPVVTAAAGEGLEIIAAAAQRHACRLIRVGREVNWEHKELAPEYQSFMVRGRLGVYEDLTLHLLGRHQQVNAATAVAAVEVLMEQGAAIDVEAVRAGLAAARWPGRLEIMRREPLVIMDGAHNVAGAEALRLALTEHFPDRRIVLMIGMLGDKERARVAEVLCPMARAVVVTKPNNPRAGNWQELAREALHYTDEVYLLEDIGEALQKTLTIAGMDELVCITGSLYMIAEARRLLFESGKDGQMF
jgi:dihydrofolate synthase/folylpolyglutamate synthase